jgi:hypothetical protein
MRNHAQKAQKGAKARWIPCGWGAQKQRYELMEGM